MILRSILSSVFAVFLCLTAALADNHKTIIDAAQAKEMHDRGVLFVDVRSKSSFERGHIPGALSIDVRGENFVAEFTEAVKKDQDVVIYCRGINCTRSGEAIWLVYPLGYDNLYHMKVGLPGWKEAGFPVKE
ncbi:rhodanese-like domain-containing protein [Sedimentitalea sp.]|uniref:rhodanese-like domain-containing protein n=1 Tax=Sedimentitalea sp. TaxID=2048915 RepID=UPI0032979DA5